MPPHKLCHELFSERRDRRDVTSRCGGDCGERRRQTSSCPRKSTGQKREEIGKCEVLDNEQVSRRKCMELAGMLVGIKDLKLQLLEISFRQTHRRAGRSEERVGGASEHPRLGAALRPRREIAPQASESAARDSSVVCGAHTVNLRECPVVGARVTLGSA
eukprot:3361186-Pleurochrysis_carterae.AAC.1